MFYYLHVFIKANWLEIFIDIILEKSKKKRKVLDFKISFLDIQTSLLPPSHMPIYSNKVFELITLRLGFNLDVIIAQ